MPPSTSFSSFQFRTIGKEPDLLKRISAPEPNQDYQDDSTPSPSPSHSPAREPTGPKPSLFQKLTNGETNTVSQTIGNALSDLGPGTSAFDPVFAALFSINVQKVQPLSIPAMGRRPKSPSDMDMSSAGTTPRIARSLSLTHPAPTDGAVGLATENTRFTSADLLNGLELAYPATEDRQEPFDSHTMDADTTSVSTPLDNVIAYLESKSLQQSKVLAAIASLESEFQLIANQTSLALDKANKAEAAAEKSLSIAKDAVAVAQHSVTAANVVNTAVENALAALVHLRQCYADEHNANEHDRADLLCKMTSLKRDIELSPSQGLNCDTPGLGNDVLRILSTEATKLVRERDPGAKKRKRCLDKMDPSSICDLTSCPLKEARHEPPILFFDRTVESEAEAAREAWVQEVERRSAVPPDPAQRTAHEQKEHEPMTRVRRDPVVEEDNHRQVALSDPTQSQLVSEDVDMSSDKPDTPLVEDSEESSAHENSYSELRARWEREVVEHKLEIARFQMQERDLKEKEDKRKEVDGMATIASEQTEQSAPLRTRPPPTFVPATTTAANTLERDSSQPTAGLSDASREKIKIRLALEKQKALPTISQGPSLPPSAAQSLSQQNVLQKSPSSVADTGRLDTQRQGQTENGGVTGKVQEKGEKGREIDNKVLGTKLRERGMLITRSSVDAKDTSRLVVGNVTAQKTLVASTQPKRATSPQRGVPQNSAIMATANVPVPPHLLLHPHSPWFTMANQFPALPQMVMGMNYGSFPLNDPLNQRRDQGTRRASLPPIECLAEPVQADSNSATKRPTSSRTLQKQKPGAKKATKPRQNTGNVRGMNVQPSGTESDSRNTPSTAPAVAPLTLASSDIFPKPEVISPTLPSIDQRTTVQEQNSHSALSFKPVTASPQQNEHIDSPTPKSVPQPLHDNHQVSSGSEPRSSETAQRRLRVEPTNALQPLPVNGQMLATAERVVKPLPKTTLDSFGQIGNMSAFLKTPHGGHREIFGSAASSKPPSRSGLVDPNVSGKAPLPMNGQQVAHDLRGEASASLNSKVDSSLGVPAASVNIPATRSLMSENPSASVNTSLGSSQTPSSDGPSTGISIHPPQLAIQTKLPAYPNSARLEARLSRSRSPLSSSPSPTNNRKRPWNVMEGNHWSPGPEARGRRPRTTRISRPLSPRLCSPNQHITVPLSLRISESNPRRNSSSYRPKDDTYRPDESPPYYSGEDDIDRPRNQSKSLLHRFTQQPQDWQGHNEFVPSKRHKFTPPRSNSREGRGGSRTLQERIS